MGIPKAASRSPETAPAAEWSSRRRRCPRRRQPRPRAARRPAVAACGRLGVARQQLVRLPVRLGPAFCHATFDNVLSQRKAELTYHGVVTLSNARMVNFEVHDSHWTKVSGLLMMPRNQTPAGSAEPAFQSNASVVSVWKLADTSIFLHSIADKARALVDRGSACHATNHRHPEAHISHSDLLRCLVAPAAFHFHDRRPAPRPRTFDDASNHELRVEQAIGEAWSDGVHILRCDAQRENKLRLRPDNVNVAAARTLNNAMHSCTRQAPLGRSAERHVHNALQMRCSKWNRHVLLDCFDDCPVHLEGAQRIQGVVVEDLCFPASVGMAVALRQAQCSLRRSKDVALAIARCSVLVFPHACVPSQRALHDHQPAIACCRKYHAAAQTSSSIISENVEWSSFEKEYGPKLQAARVNVWCMRKTCRTLDKRQHCFVRSCPSLSRSGASKEVCW